MSESNSWNVTGVEVFPKGDNPLDNKFYGYQRTSLTLPDGRSADYHGLVVPNCVHMVAIEDDLTTYLVRQSRPNLLKPGETKVPQTWEFPGGFANEALGLPESANNELREEVGRDAGKILHIGTLYPSTGVSNEQDSIYLGTELTVVGIQSTEATEQDMSIRSGPFGELYDMILSGQEPVSAQTVAAFAMAARHL